MCGIAGFSGRFERALLERMSRLVAHRGPDDCGIWAPDDRPVGLAHRRLSIIDLSPAGHQPMWDSAGRAAIVFNGEIYNYRELRAELEAQGVRFRGHSDTEVLVNLWVREGRAMLRRLNGIFAFALWDEEARELVLARDGVGVKPLYWSETASGLLFASELKALLACSEVSRDLDPKALVQHLALLWCTAPRTALRAVRKLEPGAAVRVRDGRIVESWSFYDLPYAPPGAAVDEREAAARVHDAVATAVARQMVSDVPVGAFLSGGLDSSAVVAMARRATQGPVPCFTIGFRGASMEGEGFADDLAYARRVAAHLGVELHVIEVGPEMTGRLETMIWHLDEPTADPAPLHVLSICELARSHGIKVLLSGTGGDDIFTGYRRHVALVRERAWAWLPAAVRRALAAAARRVPSGAPSGRRISKAFAYADWPADRRLASYFLWTRPDVQRPLYGPVLRDAAPADPLEPLLASLARLPAGVAPLDRMLYLDGKHFLADHNLNYGDKMSMAVGVEVRVPLLDPDLIGVAAALPPSIKQRRGVGKWVFKKAMEPYLPRDVIYRPKTGFGAPLRRWLRHELREVVEDVLSERALRERGLFDPAAVRALAQADRDGRVDGTFTIFSLVCIELWCRRFLAPPATFV